LNKTYRTAHSDAFRTRCSHLRVSLGAAWLRRGAGAAGRFGRCLGRERGRYACCARCRRGMGDSGFASWLQAESAAAQARCARLRRAGSP
jgi:hypothetical protein